MCRKSLTKIRLSAHYLHVETRRYRRPKKMPIEKRLHVCSFCLSLNIDEIEEGDYVFMNCPRYITCIRQRRNLVNRISSIYINLDLFSLTELFNLILQCKECDYIKLVRVFLKSIVEIRGSF